MLRHPTAPSNFRSLFVCLSVCFSFRLFPSCSAHLFVGTPCWWTLHLPLFPPASSLLPPALTRGGTSTAPAPSPGNRGCLGDKHVFPGGCCSLPWWQRCPQAQHGPALHLHTTDGLQKNKLSWHAKKGHKMSSRERACKETGVQGAPLLAVGCPSLVPTKLWGNECPSPASAPCPGGSYEVFLPLARSPACSAA